MRDSAVRESAVPGGASRRQPAREPAARTYARALPVVPVRARGLTIEGADGRRYLDCVSGAGTLALGHNHPVVLEAIRAVLDSGAPLHVMDLTTPVEDAFVTELLRTLPPGLAAHARVRFCGPTGTDPVATAVSLVRAATGRSRVIAVSDAPEPLPGDGGAERDRPAALLLEPVRSEAGVLPVADALVRRLRSRTAGQGVPLVVDETETGVGRTGAYWAFEHSGVTPDVLILAKAVGGSLPLAAVVHRDDLEESGDLSDPRGKGTLGVPAAAHTGATGAGAFRGNQLALAAGAATLAHVREQRLAEHAAALGDRMLTRLRALAGEFACVGDVRGRGLMAGVELVSPDGTAAELAAAVRRECLHRGLIVDVTGPCANVVRLLPPLIVTEEQMSAVLDRLFDAVRAVDRHRVGGPAALRGEHAPR
ncbi:Siderophore biosynthesis diaminobutyrate--2-oxoglutarate aminotransferase [Streptomyces sp. KO7888]|uniref:aminotransferase class III-fold pyridoxal phosphate-dependent enzyme n=1 Tax=Streptomyces sp. KO7888 TaxID=2602737 RepID=UPI0013F5BA1D|nr:aminotransferase class III-fold pyridoxal phosphate-dependent enzyme [Streptomyces sp. KO7888]NHI06718.1 Siderophore biosynthesis diaminobutyrate--2-oxoglutarate aminotransferase [Streptomyces sp. KO7888]